MTSSSVRLHLGAFNCAIPGWVNTDITPHLWIARVPFAARVLHRLGKMTDERYREHLAGQFRTLNYLDLTKSLPYGNESVEAVFSSHVFEHLFMDEVERLIWEIHRVLIPGGICRVVVPDLEKIVSLFDPENPGRFLEEIYEVGGRTGVKNAHHCGFTGRSLVNLFDAAGFCEAYVTGYHQGVCPDIEKLDNRPESLFVEAIK